MWTCPSKLCGKQIEDDEQFCYHCGRRRDGVVEDANVANQGIISDPDRHDVDENHPFDTGKYDWGAFYSFVFLIIGVSCIVAQAIGRTWKFQIGYVGLLLILISTIMAAYALFFNQPKKFRVLAKIVLVVGGLLIFGIIKKAIRY